jgi:hypothetical protein
MEVTEMRYRNFLTSGLLLFGSVLFPQDFSEMDGPRGQFQDDLISKLEGNWNLTRKIRGSEVHNSVNVIWVLNHQFLQIHMKDLASPPAYEAIVLIGYIHSSTQYTAHWCDTYGGKYSAIGSGTRSGDSIEFRFQYPDGPFFNTFTWSPGSKQWVMRLENQDSTGARRLFAVDTLVRSQ